MQQLCKLKPSMHLPIVRTAAALRAMFWLGFPWARSHKTPDMERPLVPYPKRSVRPCQTGNNELCIMAAKEYNPKTSSTQQWTISKFKSIYTSAQDVQHALSALGEYASQELNAFKLDTPIGDQSLSNQVWHHFTTVLMIWQSYLSDQPTWSKYHHHRTHLRTRRVRTKI